MERHGHLQLTLAADTARPSVPCHLDCLAGAGRPTSGLDHGPVDRTLRRWGGAFRASCVFHARRSLGRVGTQHADFDDHEHEHALSRTYRVELADRESTHEALHALRDLAQVEAVAVQTLATAPLAAIPTAVAARDRTSRGGSPEATAPFERVQARRALEMEPGDERVTIAVVDTGVALGHPEMQRKLLSGFDTVDLGMGRISPSLRLVGDSWGHDFLPQDATGHGSHVAGILGAQGWRMPRGLGGRSLLLPVRVLAAARGGTGKSGKLFGVGALPDIDAGIKVAVDLGANVLNLSLGTPESGIDPNGPRPHSAVVRYAIRRGAVLVAAAGNSGLEERFYPAALPEVIAVGSASPAGRRSTFSTWGDHIALSAPGEDIYSLAQRGYQQSTGTSHAAPFVAGTVALLLSRARRTGVSLDSAAIRRLLTASATPLSRAPRNEVGHGLLAAATALQHFDREHSRPNTPRRPQ